MQFKVWGTVYGLIGDLITSLPLLTYFEKKYPESYKYFVINKSVSQSIPLFINHPLIDKIRVTEKWEGFGPSDYELADSCDFKCSMGPAKYGRVDWYNYQNCVQGTANKAGIFDLEDVITQEEMVPKLYQWFNLNTEAPNAYKPEIDINREELNRKVVAIWPNAAYGNYSSRSPDELWWRILAIELLKKGYMVWHFGMPTDVILSEDSNYINYTDLSFFDQIRTVLLSNFYIGTDSGSSWAVAAYGHKVFVTNTEWQPNHYQNMEAMSPIGPNVTTIHKLSNKQLFEEIERFEDGI